MLANHVSAAGGNFNTGSLLSREHVNRPAGLQLFLIFIRLTGFVVTYLAWGMFHKEGEIETKQMMKRNSFNRCSSEMPCDVTIHSLW